MKNKDLKTTLIVNLIAAYLFSLAFIAGILLFKTNTSKDIILSEELSLDENKTKKEIVYVDRFIDKNPDLYYKDRLDGVIINEQELHKATVRRPGIVYSNTDPVIIHEKPEIQIDKKFNEIGIHNRVGDLNINHDNAIISRKGIAKTHVDTRRDFIDNRTRGSRINSRGDHALRLSDSTREDLIADKGLLERRLREIKDDNQVGLDTKDGPDLGNLSLATSENNLELGDISDLDLSSDGSYGVGKGGQLYAYNFPTKGVGAGIGSSAVGAGSGAGAGIGAAIGEATLDGQPVPTLGGIGDGSAPMEGYPNSSSPSGGVGGLLGGAGAGGAAGLTQGYIAEKLGVGPGNGIGYGGAGRRAYAYGHLPKNGSLHIMMHVDGSGSILNTRKQLDIMKDTILKDALLPYYNNDENLYNNRVTIVSSSGERTLKFFAEAAQKDNVLAIAFQDEAQPAYHLPNFNKKPEDHYINDIDKLKSSLNSYNGVYRGVMFQVDRGKTFAKSFKEFVGNAFQGKGYLESNSLKKYYRDNNSHHIKNKDGIVFSDEYHAKDSGDPEYYLDLIFKASKKIGLDLDIYGGGLKDGKLNNK